MVAKDPAETRISILVCDDHALLRSGLRRLLDAEDDLDVVGEAANADEAVERARTFEPDVVLLDIVMPGRSGLDALPDLLAAAPETKVLMLSMQDEPGYVRRAFASGASGYVVKDAADSELVQAVRDVMAGRPYVHPVLGARLAEPEADEHSPDDPDPLSAREREVLKLLALGHTNQEIAEQLFISVRTAETHRAHIMRKLRISTLAEIVRYALATGQLDPLQDAAQAT
jgi:two-component system, NarL family, response regulator NreC